MYSTEYSDLYHWFDLDKEINEENNKFKIFKIFDEYPNSHIYLNNIILTNIKKSQNLKFKKNCVKLLNSDF